MTVDAMGHWEQRYAKSGVYCCVDSVVSSIPHCLAGGVDPEARAVVSEAFGLVCIVDADFSLRPLVLRLLSTPPTYHLKKEPGQPLCD